MLKVSSEERRDEETGGRKKNRYGNQKSRNPETEDRQRMLQGKIFIELTEKGGYG